MNTLFQTAPPRSSRLTRVIGYGLALIFFVYVLRDFHLKRALRDIGNVSWQWVFLGMFFDVVSYCVQAIRWKFLLMPFGRVRLNRAIRAVFAALFANIVFPLRPGELLRSFLVSTGEEIKFGRVLGAVGVERLIDLVVATAGLAVVSLFVELPARFKRIADALGIITLVLLAIVVAVILYLESKLGKKAEEYTGSRRLPGKFMGALLGLHAMGTAPSFYLAVLFSLLMPFCQILALWSMMRSYNLELPSRFLAAVVVLLVINLGVSLPNAPANVGSYQFFCVLGLSVFEVEKTTATGFSIFAFLMLTLPFVFLGFAALLRSGLSWRELRAQVARLAGETAEALPSP